MKLQRKRGDLVRLNDAGKMFLKEYLEEDHIKSRIGEYQDLKDEVFEVISYSCRWGDLQLIGFPGVNFMETETILVDIAEDCHEN